MHRELIKPISYISFINIEQMVRRFVAFAFCSDLNQLTYFGIFRLLIGMFLIIYYFRS